MGANADEELDAYVRKAAIDAAWILIIISGCLVACGRVCFLYGNSMVMVHAVASSCILHSPSKLKSPWWPVEEYDGQTN